MFPFTYNGIPCDIFCHHGSKIRSRHSARISLNRIFTWEACFQVIELNIRAMSIALLKIENSKMELCF